MVIVQKEITAAEECFWNAIRIYYHQPNAINKQVLYSTTICSLEAKSPQTEADYQSVCKKLHSYLFIEKNGIESVARVMGNGEDFSVIDEWEVLQQPKSAILTLRKLFPKKSIYCDQNFYELCYFDGEKKLVRFYCLFEEVANGSPVITKSFENDPFLIVKYKKINIHYGNDSLTFEYDDELGEKGVNWINKIFINKLMKMILSKIQYQSCTRISFTSQVSVVNYYKLYEKLKLKYAKNLIQNWSENTDPQKYVFEDIGIATYLLLLWNNGELPDERSQRQRFYDLGCGNGLLVYILNSEGHSGVGLDIRKRRIWETYPPDVVLQEKAVIPGPTSVYPDADWLIGNHSDELTPWLPVMARRSNAHCQYFVIPCCPFQFNGQIYQRKNSGLSVYHDFIQYVRDISELCGFETFIDKLRIPSTKRICVLGRNILSCEDLKQINENIDSFIAKECQVTHDSEEGENWISKFKLRENVEKVRNCTKLPKELINEIVGMIANRLLKEKNIIRIKKENEMVEWNKGGKITLNELAKVLSQEQLKYLKSECKGLQTLLKNHHYVFNVSKGVVSLRNNEEMLAITKRILKDNLKWKQKDCWFHINHPDGCPLEENLCSYKHG